jgi:hypothetical protein
MTEFPLDLIELDRIDPISRASILERGRKYMNPNGINQLIGQLEKRLDNWIVCLIIIKNSERIF